MAKERTRPGFDHNMPLHIQRGYEPPRWYEGWLALACEAFGLLVGLTAVVLVLVAVFS